LKCSFFDYSCVRAFPNPMIGYSTSRIADSTDLVLYCYIYIYYLKKCLVDINYNWQVFVLVYDFVFEKIAREKKANFKTLSWRWKSSNFSDFQHHNIKGHHECAYLGDRTHKCYPPYNFFFRFKIEYAKSWQYLFNVYLPKTSFIIEHILVQFSKIQLTFLSFNGCF